MILTQKDIVVKPYDTSKLSLDFPNNWGISNEIYEHFSYFVPGYRFMPKFKCGMWDGKISLYDRGKCLLQFGLLKDLILFAKDRGYSIEVDPLVAPHREVSLEQIEAFAMDVLKLPFEPYSYQIEAVQKSVSTGRKLTESPTGSGKSLIIHIIIQWLLRVEKLDRIVLVVPTLGLVTQMYNDFKDYSQNIEFNEDDFLLIPNKQNIKRNGARVTITTWQSLQSQLPKGKREPTFKQAMSVPDDFFHDIDAILVDEVQGAKGSVLSAIVEKSNNTPIKLGFSGTLANNKVDLMVIKGLFGDIYKTLTTSELIDLGLAAELKITAIQMNHPKPKEKLSYAEEMKYLRTKEERIQYIVSVASALGNNTLILFNSIEHGNLLKMYADAIAKGKKIFLITGTSSPEEREYVRTYCLDHDDAIIFATYPLFQAGVNIPNLHNLVMAEPTKSGIRLFQSIGRVLRLHSSKSHARLLDFYDDLTGGDDKKGSRNYTLSHFIERYQMYMDASFDVNVIQGKSFLDN